MEADMSLFSLVSRASTLVQLVMLALLAASVLSLSLIHISEPTRPFTLSRMPSSA